MPDPTSQTASAQGMPIPFLTAAWSGMSYDAIVAGLHAGSILPPPGAAADWLPQPGTVGVAYAPASAVAAESSMATASAGLDDVARWFGTLDPALSSTAFDAIWQRAGGTDAQRAGNLTSYLARTLLGSPAATNAQSDASAGVGAALDAFLADPAHRAHVVDLASMNGAELAAQGTKDVGVRYALAHMDSVALGGNRALFGMSNADGALDRFDRDTGESLVSDAWLEDRGKFLAWKLAHDDGSELAVAGSEDWTFVDRASADAQGNPLTLQLRTGADDAGHNQVVFGTEDTDVMKGLRGSDRMYGGSGDDVLLGGAGGDHLEGGAGADVVMGGAGNDELVGNQGDDEIDGGAGIDTLQAGSGDDAVTGGRGDDQLEGGLGHDTYVLDAGDGNDTIVDSDGLGAIELDGTTVGGSMALDGGGWKSADGRIEFTFDGTAGEAGTLTMRAFAAGADHDGPPDNVVRIRDWKNGDLGITLGGGLQDSAAGQATTTSSNGTEVAGSSAGEEAAVTSGEFAGEGVIVTSNGSVPASDASLAMAPGDESSAVVATTSTDVADTIGPMSAEAAPADASASDAGLFADMADGFDFSAALDTLLDSGVSPAKGLDPVAFQRGVEAFSAPLAPPDVGAFVGTSSDAAPNALTAADIADAMAGDVSGDLDAEHAGAYMATLGGFPAMEAVMAPSVSHLAVPDVAQRRSG